MKVEELLATYLFMYVEQPNSTKSLRHAQEIIEFLEQNGYKIVAKEGDA